MQYTGAATDLAAPAVWNDFIHQLWRIKWVVYPKATGKNPEQALDYLARYTNKVAIGNHRLLNLHDGPSTGSGQATVTFSWRDRADGNQLKTCTLPELQFIGRLVLHILPRGFAKVRSYGWLAGRHKMATLPAIRAALGVPAPSTPPVKETTVERVLRLTGVDMRLCPACGKRTLIYVGRIGSDTARGPP